MFPLTSHCTIHKDIILDDIIKLRVYVGLLADQKHRQTMLNMLNFLDSPGDIGQK